jgi:N-acetylglutamate synthase-like GNAT family acetyltransferase
VAAIPLESVPVVTYLIEQARGHDLGPALELLRLVDLPSEGVAERFGHYLVARQEGDLIGLCGIETCGPVGLLRSLSVEPAFRDEGIGTRLVGAAEDLARKLDLAAVYLLTTTARDFFAGLGYAEYAREEAPDGIRESWEFRSGCPRSAILMKKDLR